MGDGVQIMVLPDTWKALQGQAAGYFQDKGGDAGFIGDQADGAGEVILLMQVGDFSYISYAGYGILSSGLKSTMVKDENNKRKSNVL